MKCSYSKCFCQDSNDFPIIEKKNKYHQKCFDRKEIMKEIIDIFAKNIDDDKHIFPNLRRIIDNIVFNDGVDPEFLRFGLWYFINNNKNLKHPAGLYYVIKDEDVKKAYAKATAPKIDIEIIPRNLKEEIKQIAPKKKKKFGDFL